jgi:hypothetical protein
MFLLHSVCDNKHHCFILHSLLYVYCVCVSILYSYCICVRILCCGDIFICTAFVYVYRICVGVLYLCRCIVFV